MEYEKLYKDLGIVVEPLSQDYNPESYGKHLMETCQYLEGVIYAVSTDKLEEEKGIIF